MKTDSTKKFIPVNIAVLTISDTRDESTDTSGNILANKIKELGHAVVSKKILRDDKEQIKKTILAWCDEAVDIIISTGGTGLTGRDITIEALDEIKDKDIPGFGEIFRMLSYKTIGTSTIQSRAQGIICKGKYIFALPGSSGAVTDAWEGILKFQLDSRFQPCNFINIIPRLKEK
ncbi:MAG: molybdenum cofactor biosynthesis protein [Pseudomonadota bacterium]